MINLIFLLFYFPLRLLKEFVTVKLPSTRIVACENIDAIYITHSDGNKELCGKDYYFLNTQNANEYFLKIHRETNELEENANCGVIYLKSRNLRYIFRYWEYFFVNRENNFIGLSSVLSFLMLSKFSHFKLASMLIERFEFLESSGKLSKRAEIFLTCEGHYWEHLLIKFAHTRDFTNINLYAHSAMTRSQVNRIAELVKTTGAKLFVSYEFQRLNFLTILNCEKDIEIELWGSTKSQMQSDLERLGVNESCKVHLVLVEGLYTEIVGTVLFLMINTRKYQRDIFYFKIHPRISDFFIWVMSFLVPCNIKLDKIFPSEINKTVLSRGTFANYELAEQLYNVDFFYPQVPWLPDKDIFASLSGFKKCSYLGMCGVKYDKIHENF